MDCLAQLCEFICQDHPFFVVVFTSLVLNHSQVSTKSRKFPTANRIAHLFHLPSLVRTLVNDDMRSARNIYLVQYDNRVLVASNEQLYACAVFFDEVSRKVSKYNTRSRGRDL